MKDRLSLIHKFAATIDSVSGRCGDAFASHPRLFPVVACICALCAGLLFIFATPGGLVVDSRDSVVYLETARNILAGNGFYFADGPLTHYPPGYPLLLAAASLFSGDPLNNARLLHALIFAVSTLLVGFIGYRLTNKSKSAGIISMLLFFTSPVMLFVHVLFRSEAPFILFVLLTFLFIFLHKEKPSLINLIGISVCASFATMVRYAGITLMVPAVFLICCLEDRPIAKRIRDSLILLALWAVPLIVWLVRNTLLSQTAVNRPVVFHPFNAKHVKSFLLTLYDISFPFNCTQNLLKIFLIIAAVLVIFALLLPILRKALVKARDDDSAKTTLVTMVLFFAAYSFFLFFSISLIDARIPLDGRMMSPLFVMIIFLLIDTAYNFEIRRKKYWIKKILLVCIAIIIIGHAHTMVDAVKRYHAYNWGYTGQAWKNSEGIAWVRALPPAAILYSNAPDLVRLLTQRKVSAVPYKYSPYSLIPNVTLANEMTALQKDMTDKNAVVVYFEGFNNRQYIVSKKDLESLDGVTVIANFKDSVVYAMKQPQHQPD